MPVADRGVKAAAESSVRQLPLGLRKIAFSLSAESSNVMPARLVEAGALSTRRSSQLVELARSGKWYTSLRCRLHCNRGRVSPDLRCSSSSQACMLAIGATRGPGAVRAHGAFCGALRDEGPQACRERMPRDAAFSDNVASPA